MRASRTQLLCLLLVVAGHAACRSNPAPRGWLAPAEDAAGDPYGAWVAIRIGDGDRSQVVQGELIAVSDDSVFVLTQEAQFLAVAQASTTRAVVAFYASQADLLAAWTFTGTLATVSHGWFAALSAPVWLIAGSIATASQSRAPLEDVSPTRSSWPEVSKYSRFPQGLPPGLNRSQLRPKTRARVK